MAASRLEAPGWYGKLMPLGDFASRRLDAASTGRCDAWLVAVMSGLQAELGGHWLQAYLSAPVLRLAWTPGAIDERWWFGVLMPSCDKVGRYFPLLVVQPRASPPADRIAIDHLELWFQHLARAALWTLDEQASIQSFEQALHDAPPWPTSGVPAALLPAGSGASHASYTLAGRAAPLSGWLHALALQTLQSQLAGTTLWWRCSEGAPATLAVVRGLPDAAAFAALLTGQGGPT